MYLVWKGWGILNVPIVFLGLLFAVIMESSIYGDIPKGGSHHGWIYAGGFLLAAVGVWFAGKGLNRKYDNKTYIDTDTGREFKYPTRHSFFFIRMEYWAFALVAIAILSLFM